MHESENESIRYNAVILKRIYEQLKSIADYEGTTTIDIIRRFIKLGLYVYYESLQGKSFYVKQNDNEEKIKLIL